MAGSQPAAAVKRGEVATVTTDCTRRGAFSAMASATSPPRDQPSRWACSGMMANTWSARKSRV